MVKEENSNKASKKFVEYKLKEESRHKSEQFIMLGNIMTQPLERYKRRARNFLNRRTRTRNK